MELCHFGENCAPGIIINDILKINTKQLFMLGTYPLNNILSYLKDGNYEKIYDTDNLIIMPDNTIRHSKYDFIFNHDYTVLNSKISNYDFIVSRFNTKIKNFREMLLSENMCIFIVFTNNIDDLKINEVLDWLTLNKKNFHLMIFTSNKHNTVIDSKLCSIINLKNNYYNWWAMEQTPKMILYTEIYDEFINCLKKNNIEHNLPLK